ncbi:hypothetical protein N0V90_011167 [Kalmusia sp. IMI 367209]|nr:hypothetical protein N0V90_011167 [Kalmusia sp. IMI 367209]
MPHHVLLVGLDPLDPPPHDPIPPHVLKSIAEKIAVDIARATRNGFPCTPHYLNWRDPAAGFAELERVLEEGKDGEKKWEAVLFGQGIRMWKDPVLFEGAIAAVRKAVLGY